jgi:phosphoglycolate phosphatase
VVDTEEARSFLQEQEVEPLATEGLGRLAVVVRVAEDKVPVRELGDEQIDACAQQIRAVALEALAHRGKRGACAEPAVAKEGEPGCERRLDEPRSRRPDAEHLEGAPANAGSLGLVGKQAIEVVADGDHHGVRVDVAAIRRDAAASDGAHARVEAERHARLLGQPGGDRSDGRARVDAKVERRPERADDVAGDGRCVGSGGRRQGMCVLPLGCELVDDVELFGGTRGEQRAGLAQPEPCCPTQTQPALARVERVLECVPGLCRRERMSEVPDRRASLTAVSFHDDDRKPPLDSLHGMCKADDSCADDRQIDPLGEHAATLELTARPSPPQAPSRHHLDGTPVHVPPRNSLTVVASGGTSMIGLVVLDLAGTLVRDDGAVEGAFVDALRSVRAIQADGPDDALLAMVRETMGRSKIVVFREWLDDEDSAQAANHAFELAYAGRVRAGECTALPGADETLEELRGSGIALAVTTGFSERTRDLLLEVLGWTDVVDIALSPSAVLRGRPAPDLVLAAALEAKVSDMQHVAVVGDTTNDLLSGYRAGAGILVGVLTGAHSREALEGVPHTHVLDSVADVPDVVREPADPGRLGAATRATSAPS